MCIRDRVETLTQHAARDVGGDHAGTAACGIPAALGGSGTDLKQPPASEDAQETGIGLTQALGPPHEVVVAEKGPVLRVVVAGLDVPPRPVGPRRLDRICPSPARPVRAVSPVSAGSPTVVLVGYAHAHILPDPCPPTGCGDSRALAPRACPRSPPPTPAPTTSSSTCPRSPSAWAESCCSHPWWAGRPRRPSTRGYSRFSWRWVRWAWGVRVCGSRGRGGPRPRTSGGSSTTCLL